MNELQKYFESLNKKYSPDAPSSEKTVNSLLQFSQRAENTKTMTIKEATTISIKGKFAEYTFTRISLN